MTNVSIRELRNHGGDVVDRVTRGEQVLITRDGRPVAELRPIPQVKMTAEAFLERWRSLPPVDPDVLRADIDGVASPWL